jgi:hypothetical protein
MRASPEWAIHMAPNNLLVEKKYSRDLKETVRVTRTAGLLLKLILQVHKP